MAKKEQIYCMMMRDWCDKQFPGNCGNPEGQFRDDEDRLRYEPCGVAVEAGRRWKVDKQKQVGRSLTAEFKVRGTQGYVVELNFSGQDGEVFWAEGGKVYENGQELRQIEVDNLVD